MSEVSGNINTNGNKNSSVGNKMLGAFLSPPISVPANKAGENSTSNFDERSGKGQFGWFTLGNVHVPYIYRNDQQYCSVRMVELSALNSFLRYLNKDIYNCTNIRSYYVTPTEASLLNQINFLHCDSQYGRDQFTVKDLMVKVSDTVEFYQFLGACYSKLLNGKPEPDSRLGFVIINNESDVPYTISKGQKYVPLFYFEGEIDQLKLRSYKLEGWDLCYLKFCCKIQGIRNQLFAHDTCSVINLEDIKIYFPPETTFDEYWPTKKVDMQMLLGSKSQAPIGEWTKQPTMPPMYPLPQPALSAPAPIIYKHNPPYVPAVPHGTMDIRPYPAGTTAPTGQPTMYNYMNLA